MSVLKQTLFVLALLTISAVAFRPALIESHSDDRMLDSSIIQRLETNKPRTHKIDTITTGKFYWDVPTVPVPMKIEVTPQSNDAYQICYNPEVYDYDQDIDGVCQDVAGGFGSVPLTAALLRKWHGKNLRIYVKKPITNPSVTAMDYSIVIKRDNQKALAIGVGVGVGGAALLAIVTCAIFKCKKGKPSKEKDNAKKDKKYKKDKKNDKDNKDDKDDKEDKEKKDKNDKKKRKNSQDSDQEPETAEHKRCSNCHCHKESNEHLRELEYCFPSNRFENLHNHSQQPSCLLCTVHFKPDASCRQLYCGHIFHTACIDNQAHKNNRCPTCNISLSREAIQSVVMSRYNEQRAAPGKH